MNDKLSLQDLADILSQQTQISKKEAESFFKEFFQLILDRIYENDLVKVKDFGTFKLTAINSRESVDVNTGEKIEIPAHYRFTFLPDKALKELVNEPFSKYQTVLLEEGMDPSDVNFELQTNTEEDTINDNEVSKVIQEQVKLVNELKTQPTKSSNESVKTAARGAKIGLIDKIEETTSVKEEPKNTTRPFVYTYSKSKLGNDDQKSDDVILMTVPRRGRIPKIGEDDNIKSDNSVEVIEKKDVKSTLKQSDIDDTPSVDIETTIYSISDNDTQKEPVKDKKTDKFDTSDSDSISIETNFISKDLDTKSVSTEDIPVLHRKSTISRDSKHVANTKSYNNPDRPLIPKEESKVKEQQDLRSAKKTLSTIDDVEDIDIDTTFVALTDTSKKSNKEEKKTPQPKNILSSETEVRDVENDPFFNFETKSAKRSKQKKIIPIVILILVVLAIIAYGLFKLFDVKYDYERYQGLGSSNLTMADTLPYIYEKEEPLPITTKDTSIVQNYADSLSDKNTVIVETDVLTDTLASTVKNVDGSLLIDGSDKNGEIGKDGKKRPISNNLSINVVNKAQLFLRKRNELKESININNLIESQVQNIEADRNSKQKESAYNNLVRLEPGMTLRSIASKYYGNANYWVYIYITNKEKLPNPDAITAGVELVVPPLSQYGIADPKDPLELEKAQQLEAQILR